MGHVNRQIFLVIKMRKSVTERPALLCLRASCSVRLSGLLPLGFTRKLSLLDGARQLTALAQHWLQRHVTTGLLFSLCCLCLSDDPVQFREDLLAIARTTISSKILTAAKEHFAQLAVNAVLRLKVTIFVFLSNCHRKAGIWRRFK